MYSSMLACSFLNAVRSILATLLCLVLLLLLALESNSIAFAAGDPETDLVPRTDICTQNLIGGKNATQDPLPTNVVIRRGKAGDNYFPTGTTLTVNVYDAGSVKDLDQIYLVVKNNGFEKFRTGVITLQEAKRAVNLGGFGPGISELEVVTVTQNNGTATIGLNFKTTHMVYGYADCKFDGVIGAPVDIFTKFLQVTISSSLYKAATDHIIDALNGVGSSFQTGPAPTVLTYRANTPESRKIRLKSTARYEEPRQPSEDRDEYPFASTFENNGSNASIRAINLSANRGSDGSYRAQIEEWLFVRGDNFEVVVP